MSVDCENHFKIYEMMAFTLMLEVHLISDGVDGPLYVQK